MIQSNDESDSKIELTKSTRALDATAEKTKVAEENAAKRTDDSFKRTEGHERTEDGLKRSDGVKRKEHVKRTEDCGKRADDSAKRSGDCAKRTEDCTKGKESVKRTEDGVMRTESVKITDDVVKRSDDCAKRSNDSVKRTYGVKTTEDGAKMKEDGAKRKEDCAKRIEDSAKRMEDCAKRKEDISETATDLTSSGVLTEAESQRNNDTVKTTKPKPVKANSTTRTTWFTDSETTDDVTDEVTSTIFFDNECDSIDRSCPVPSTSPSSENTTYENVPRKIHDKVSEGDFPCVGRNDVIGRLASTEHIYEEIDGEEFELKRQLVKVWDMYYYKIFALPNWLNLFNNVLNFKFFHLFIQVIF